MKNQLYKLPLAFVLLMLSVNFSFSQVDPEAPVFGVDYFPQKMALVKVPPYSYEPYGIDAVVSVGPFDNIKATTSAGFGEPHIDVNPRNPLNFVAGDNRAISTSSNVHVTTNGGLTWTNSTTGVSQGDPVFAYDSLGNVYYTVLSSGVRVYKSTNSGTSWTNLGNAFSNGNTDKQWVICDQTGGPYTNNLYLTYSDFSAPVTIRFYRSTNQGTSWSAPFTIFGPGSAQGSNLAVGPDGKVYVLWMGSGGANLRISSDGGVTFGSQLIVAAYSEPGTLHGSGRQVLKGDIRVNGFPQIAADLSTSPNRGNLYTVYAANPVGPDNADIFLVRSTNSGLNWNTFAPLRVNDDVGFTDQWMPDVSVDNQGRVWVMWYDSRNDPNNILTEVYCAVSTDGGVSFSPSFKVSNQPFNPNSVKVNQGGSPAHYYIGDYHSIAGKSVVLPFWMDGRSNAMDDYTAQLPDFGISFAKTADSLTPGGTRANTVNAPVMGPYSGTVNYTATVTPAPGAGTITFNWVPSNQLTTFPGSLVLSYTVSAAVPLGTYTINVTGTETGPVARTHTRSFPLVVTTLVGVSGNNAVPNKFSLMQNYPNPFNPSTTIRYSVPSKEQVTIKVYDMMGREVMILVNGIREAGSYDAVLDASGLTSGIYYYEMKAGEFTDVKKLLLVK
jgi:hypothetical protein